MEVDFDSSSGSESDEFSDSDPTYDPEMHHSVDQLWGSGYFCRLNDYETASESHHDSPDASRRQRSEESDSDQSYDNANTESDSGEDTSTDDDSFNVSSDVIPDTILRQKQRSSRYSGNTPQTLANTETRHFHKGGQGYGYQQRKKKRFPYKHKRQTRYQNQKPYTSQPHREQAEPIEVTPSEIKEAVKEFRFKPKQPGEEDIVVALNVVKNIMQGYSELAEIFSEKLARPIISDYESYGGTAFLSSSGVSGTSSAKANAPPAADKMTVTITNRKTSGRKKKIKSEENGKIQMRKIPDFFQRM